MGRLSRVALVLAALALHAGASGAEEIAGRARVIDGDSLVLGDIEIRLHGIDAPEGRQHCTVRGQAWACGRAAAETLGMLLANRDVRCAWEETDAHGRALATCHRGEIDINAMMVEVGMALAYRHYSLRYASEEDAARAARRGVWDSDFVPPWEWRESARTAAAVTDTECPVKGNVNRHGARIYHREGWPHYARVILRPEEGDRCFASEDEARAAGFRAAVRGR